MGSVETVELREGRANLVCTTCLRDIMKKRVISSLIATLVALGLAILGIQIGGWGYVLALGSAALVIPGARFPAGIGQLMGRSTRLVAAGIALLAFIDPA